LIKATSTIDEPLNIFATANGSPVYLDNWAMINLAKGDSSRRSRFIEAVRTGADLLFSVANAVELAGPSGKSFDAVKSFLDQLGPHWVPIELNPFLVMEREQNGQDPTGNCISKDFMGAYFQNQTAHFTPGSGKIIDLGSDFFRLGAVMDWVTQSDRLRKQSAEFDDVLRQVRARFEQSPSLLNQRFPTFDPLRPATFTCRNLSRILILESKSHQVKKGDGLDFCHAAMGSAFASFATLDNNWKRRVEDLPKPNRLAHIYGPSQLDQMVTDIELALKHRSPPSQTR
jgi:hypothetical protein